MSNQNNDLKSILDQGQGNSKFAKKEDQKFTPSELLKKYFVPRVPQGSTSAKYTARIVPNAKGGSPFIEVKFHQIKVGPTWKKFLCLEELGEDCPLCDTAAGFIASGDKESAKPYRAQKYFIVRVIERGKEDEGIKFWRFKENYKKEGELDKIKAKIELDYDVLSTNDEGYDLIISCALDERGNSKITDISCSKKPIALADSDEKIAALVNDEITWKDVFKPQTAEYLESVVNGTAQYWDATLKKYVTPGKAEQASVSENVVNDGAKTNPLLKDEKITEEGIVNDTDEEDLPF